MADNPAETAAAELKKWLDQLQAMFKTYQEEQAKQAALIKEQQKEALLTQRHDEMMKELRGIKEGLEKMPEGPEKEAVGKEVADTEHQIEQAVDGLEVDVSDLNEVAGPGVEEAFEAAEGLQEGLEEGVKGLEESVKGVTDAVQSIGGAAGGGADGGALAKIGEAAGGEKATAWKPGSVGDELRKQGNEIKRPGGPKIGLGEQAPKIGGLRR